MQSKQLKTLYHLFLSRLQFIYEPRESENIARWALMHLLRIDNRAGFQMMLSHDVQEEDWTKSEEWLSQLEKGMPLQYLIGEVEFYDLSIQVNEHVLIPRPETEELVFLAIQNLGSSFNGSILDIGTGSGCIALALKKALPHALVHAIDVSEDALKTAMSNGAFNHLEVHFKQMDVLSEEPPGTYDVMISNPPYIPVNERTQLSKNVVEHEPGLALFTPDDDALIFYRRMMELSVEHLNAQGLMYFELHEDFAGETQVLGSNYFEHSELLSDLQGKKRFLRLQNKKARVG